MPYLAPSFFRVASLQPSVSVMLAELGLLERLVACTRYCGDIIPELTCGSHLVIQDSWTAKTEEILAAKPDLVIASVPYQMTALAEILKTGIPCLALAPKTLGDVYKDLCLIANILGHSDRAETVIAKMQAEIDATRQKVAAAPRPRVYCEEWGKPLILSQHWVLELVEAAGGSYWGTPGQHTAAETVVADPPDVICLAWCGAGGRVPLERLVARRGWQHLPAVKNVRVYCISDEYLNTPAPTLLYGLRALSAAIHPEIFGEGVQGLRRIDPATLQNLVAQTKEAADDE